MGSRSQASKWDDVVLFDESFPEATPTDVGQSPGRRARGDGGGFSVLNSAAPAQYVIGLKANARGKAQ
jgi:hypothetical protein